MSDTKNWGYGDVQYYSIARHDEVNQKYDKYLPYRFHLEMVDKVAAKYIYLIPQEFHKLVRGGCWGHDLLEDTHVTYNDISDKFGEELAELIYACTNEKGRNRKERANAAFYELLRNTRFARFVKLCDRIANAFYSCYTRSGMFNKYAKENPDFLLQLAGDELRTLQPMVDDLKKLFETGEFTFHNV
jgi:(p)ppGpp synthase/HD superfamily hydrolase